MRKVLLFTAFLLMSHFIFAQTRSLFLEFGGNGCGLSANFDSRFGKKENGFGYRWVLVFHRDLVTPKRTQSPCQWILPYR